MNIAAEYFGELCRTTGEAWNRFWMTPTDTYRVSVLRILIGALGICYVVAGSGDLIRWYGPDGLLPAETVRNVSAVPGAGSGYYLSYFNFIDSPTALWVVHVLGIAVLAAFTLGWKSRITSIMALVVMLSYINRAPMANSLAEPVLAMMFLYLCIAPSGAWLSLDRWRRRDQVQEQARLAQGGDYVEKSWQATLAVRLMQVHLAALCLAMGLSKLGGMAWWSGGAMWILIAQTESRLVDLTFLRNNMFVINALTHGVVIFELLYGLLIWNRMARPLLIAASVLVWTFMAMVTGAIFFHLALLVASVAFVSPEILRRVVESLATRAAAGSDSSKPSDKKEKAATV